jgi:hypothetical protein
MNLMDLHRFGWGVGRRLAPESLKNNGILWICMVLEGRGWAGATRIIENNQNLMDLHVEMGWGFFKAPRIWFLLGFLHAHIRLCRGSAGST